ncbi:hypothetical protein Thiowin_01131 [Thiorhodovibrio winogradskyi]|uniref:Uncharacterized protein n=1 Tax=Thiorhodovibrio winogradskyi TaxID=77007 RepID=A0ABZ0S574_9GAMM|nr:endoglucanase [Thiorhodovibrio winogradskyi]
MLISGHLNLLPLNRQWDQPSLAEREAAQPAATHPADDKTEQRPFTPRPVLEPEQAERFSRRHARSSALAVEENSPRARQALDAYHDVSTNQEREYVRAVFGVDIYV